ncbi:unnamed protein product, partial [Rotaria magnacalcarata]
IFCECIKVYHQNVLRFIITTCSGNGEGLSSRCV